MTIGQPQACIRHEANGWLKPLGRRTKPQPRNRLRSGAQHRILVVEELRQRTVDLVGDEVALPELADRGARGVEGGLAAALLGRAAQPRRTALRRK